jgi:hypothetical protein
MNKLNKIHAFAILSMLSVAVAAPVVSYAANRPSPIKAEPIVAPTPVHEEHLIPAPPEVVEVIEMQPLKIVANPTVVKKSAPKRTTRCWTQELEQGGRPGARNVRVCEYN